MNNTYSEYVKGENLMYGKFRTLKKLLAVSICAVMICGAGAAAGNIAGTETAIEVNAAETQSLNGFEFSEKSNGTIIITKYRGEEKDLEIPSELNGKAVSAIGDYAFFNNKIINNVIIPDGITTLGYASFSGCSQLKTVTIPESVKNIDISIFDRSRKGNFALQSITGKVGSAAQTFANQYDITFINEDAPAVLPEMITLSTKAVSIGVGEEFNLNPQISPSDAKDKTITWLPEDTDVVSISNGKIRGIKEGTVRLIATTVNSKRAFCNVTVKNAPTDVQLNISSMSLGLGESAELSAVLPAGSASAIRTFTSSNTSVVKLTKSYCTAKFKAVGIGTSRITVTLYNGVQASCTVTVRKMADSVRMNLSTLSMGVGESYRLTSVIPSGTAAAQRTYSTNNSSVIKMTKTNWTGDFVALKKGTANVSVRLSNGKQASCKITVKDGPSSVAVSKKTMSMMPGDTGTLSCIIPNGTAAAVRTWRSNNSSVIRMTKTNWTAGFKAVGTGTAWVTVRLYNGKEASCKITVKEAYAKIYLSPSNQDGNLYEYGHTNECDQCNRIADAAKIALERCGFAVMKAPKGQDMMETIAESNAWGADLHMPIHTNAGGGNGTLCMVFKADKESLKFAKPIYEEVQAVTPGKVDYGVREMPWLSELKYTNSMAVYTEVDFHDNSRIAKWIIEHPQTIGEALAKGVCRAYNVPYTAP